MEILRVSPGTKAVHASQLVIVHAAQRGGQVTVRDLASGEALDAAVDELSARMMPIRAVEDSRSHLNVVPANPMCYRGAQEREKIVVAALVGREPLRLAVE